MNAKYCFLIIFLFAGELSISCSGRSEGTKKQLKNEAFPIPYPEDGDVIPDKWDGTSGHRTVKYPDKQHRELIDFYNDYTSGSDWKRTTSGKGAIPAVIYVHLHKGYTIDIGPPDTQMANAVLISLYVADYSDL